MGAAEDVLQGLDREALKGARLVAKLLEGADLSGCDLSGADLSQANLSGANLAGAKLQGATLFQTRLDGADLTGADLTGAEMSECKAPRAGFGRANLTDATLFGAELTEASFVSATLRGANLGNTSLQRARLREADLTDATFAKAVASGADLEATQVAGAVFDHCDLRDTVLRSMRGYLQASWIHADVRDVDFSGAYLLRREIMDSNYLHEFRHESRLNAAVYWVWWATSDCGRSVTRWGAWTALIALVFGFAFKFVPLNISDETWLSTYYFSVVTLTTLGYGEITPASQLAQWLAIAEVLMGYTMLGGLLSIFANKMARRAE